ncbi:MAG: PilZ domain-containing protein [Gammaproteobacteria bacterium]|nr:PilZ domain-containing protein [Gammaproteobacteria bacterium]
MNQENNIKREYARVAKEAPIEIRELSYPPSDSPGDAAIAKNIAENGICLTVSKPYTPNTMIILKIDLKGWRQYLKNVAFRVDEAKARAPLAVVAKVIWCDKLGEHEYEVGIEFMDIYEDDKIAFSSYLKAINSTSP